jgi:hypothetical protein
MIVVKVTFSAGLPIIKILKHLTVEAYYFTYVTLENRLAKYVEQLLFDIYDIALNTGEKKGKTGFVHISRKLLPPYQLIPAALIVRWRAKDCLLISAENVALPSGL